MSPVRNLPARPSLDSLRKQAKKLARDLRSRHHLVIDPGYGKIQGKTFRLSNMGDETEETVSHLLTCLDDVL